MSDRSATQTTGARDAARTASGASSLFLLYAGTPVEEKVIREWTPEADGDGTVIVHAGRGALEDRVAATARATRDRAGAGRLAAAPSAAGARAARLRDLLAGRNPRRPRAAAQRRILRDEPDRCRVVVGEPARLSDLRTRLRGAPGANERLADFVSRQGVLALERAERSLVGTQYKVPRFVSEEISASGRFRDGVAELAERLERPDERGGPRRRPPTSTRWSPAQSRLAIDVWGQFGRWLSRAYEIDVDDGRASTELRELNRTPAARVPARATVLPRPARPAQRAARARLPAQPRARRHQHDLLADRPGRAGARASSSSAAASRTTPVYKFALRQYMAYLLRKRFNLEWYIEGGRSRTGKLRPPRYGLLRLPRRRLPRRRRRRRLPRAGLDRLRPALRGRRDGRRGARGAEGRREPRLARRLRARAGPRGSARCT